MPPVHDGLGITDANWTTFMKIISDGMEERRYPAEVRAEFLDGPRIRVAMAVRVDDESPEAVVSRAREALREDGPAGP